MLLTVLTRIFNKTTSKNKFKLEHLNTSGTSISHIYCTGRDGSWWCSKVGRLLHWHMYSWLREDRNHVHQYKEMPLSTTLQGLFMV